MKLIYAFILLVSLAACKDSKKEAKIPDNFDYGETVNGVYTNKFFGFEMIVPEGWAVQTKDQLKQVMNEGANVIEQNNKQLADQIRADQVRYASLFAAFKNKENVPGEFNSSIAIAAENISIDPSIKTGKQYLENVKKLLEQSGMGYTFPKEIGSDKLGDKEFAVLETSADNQGTTVRQIYYATVDKKFALGAVASYSKEEEREKFINYLHNIKFK